MTPVIQTIVETVIYVDDLPRAIDFYARILGLELQLSDSRFAAFTVAQGQVFLIFLRGESIAGAQTAGGFIPPHDARGQQHFAFGVSAVQLDAWATKLVAAGVKIESTVDWPRGGRSLYFRDPDGHLVELITPGVWTNY
jgi:catechol 2,3-dioxygenase-like lactoylglutathione lyase family enzyme